MGAGCGREADGGARDGEGELVDVVHTGRVEEVHEEPEFRGAAEQKHRAVVLAGLLARRDGRQVGLARRVDAVLVAHVLQELGRALPLAALLACPHGRRERFLVGLERRVRDELVEEVDGELPLPRALEARHSAIVREEPHGAVDLSDFGLDGIQRAFLDEVVRVVVLVVFYVLLLVLKKGRRRHAPQALEERQALRPLPRRAARVHGEGVGPRVEADLALLHLLDEVQHGAPVPLRRVPTSPSSPPMGGGVVRGVRCG
mmetsp:Transcript_5787/g.24155  ORF Transcript_5787/g.24155 Transcript_5787/m.24155 type:complete len:259 (-) Transcript_5787:582-1358(-)